jgi:hypothetical protein
MQVVNEAFNKSPFYINKQWLPKTLYSKMVALDGELSTWANPRYQNPGDALKLIKGGITLLHRKYGINFAESDACPSA